jgi:tRNA uridine 5-carboxymethylaminomethyl modification enzyme
MSCNPAIGGLGKSHIVREIGAMGGIMPIATDMSGIQYRTLNTRKGDAVQALRVQCDRDLYKKAIQKIIKETDIKIFNEEVVDLIVDKNQVHGVITSKQQLKSKKTILTTGTFLNGKMYTGNEINKGGRLGDTSAIPLSKRLYDLKLPMGRLKTGTPARIKLSSIDVSQMEIQPGEKPTPWMSLYNRPKKHQRQIPCYITRTNQKTHKIIEENTHLSAMFSGNITGIGPRYCPSIEDKVSRFRDKDSHQIFIEPEGINKDLVYPNGISTSLPKEAQEEFIYSIKGLKNSVIEEYGYAVEYDFIDPRSLNINLENKKLKNFYQAGQINGTTGYEEAAAQGLIAGINAAAKILNQKEFVLKRSEAYIGVLVDDLTTHGITEPYRMFTSRAEHRLMLSQNNAEQRLLKKAFKRGLVSEHRYNEFIKNEQKYKNFLTETLSKKKINSFINNKNINIKLDEKKSVLDLLRRTDANKEKVFKTNPSNKHLYQRAITEHKYQGYIKKQLREIKKTEKQENKKIPNNIDYNTIAGLSNEVKEKLKKTQPSTIGSASRMEGVTPAAINLILIQIKKREAFKQNA